MAHGPRAALRGRLSRPRPRRPGRGEGPARRQGQGSSCHRCSTVFLLLLRSLLARVPGQGGVAQGHEVARRGREGGARERARGGAGEAASGGPQEEERRGLLCFFFFFRGPYLFFLFFFFLFFLFFFLFLFCLAQYPPARPRPALPRPRRRLRVLQRAPLRARRRRRLPPPAGALRLGLLRRGHLRPALLRARRGSVRRRRRLLLARLRLRPGGVAEGADPGQGEGEARLRVCFGADGGDQARDLQDGPLREEQRPAAGGEESAVAVWVGKGR